jgi:hypothetical protein
VRTNSARVSISGGLTLALAACAPFDPDPSLGGHDETSGGSDPNPSSTSSPETTAVPDDSTTGAEPPSSSSSTSSDEESSTTLAADESSSTTEGEPTGPECIGGCALEALACHAANFGNEVAIDCGLVTLGDDLATWQAAHDCARDAFEAGAAAFVIAQVQGFDSLLLDALLRSNDPTQIAHLHYDGWGTGGTLAYLCDDIAVVPDCEVYVGNICLECVAAQSTTFECMSDAEDSNVDCADGVDNDDDGYTDCDDFDCSASYTITTCSYLENTDEKCSDGFDNDKDGYVDCEDFNCTTSAQVSVCD